MKENWQPKVGDIVLYQRKYCKHGLKEAPIEAVVRGYDKTGDPKVKPNGLKTRPVKIDCLSPLR